MYSPLQPETCQSVQIRFLALEAGVHAIDNLTLTDIQSGQVAHLRYIMHYAFYAHTYPLVVLLWTSLFGTPILALRSKIRNLSSDA